MNKYTVSIKSPNSFIFFRNKQIRTPAVLTNVSKSQLDLLEQQAKFNSLSYEITLEKQSLYDFEDIFTIDDTVKENLPNPLLIEEEEKEENETNRYNI